MKFSIPVFITQILLIFLFCDESIAQSAYPPILLDSNALTEKIGYLQKVGQSKDLYSGPNINLLAEEGITFTEAYSTFAVCNPSRAGLLTGRYQHRFGNERQIMTRYAKNKFEYFIFKHFINTRPMYLVDPWFSPSEEEKRKQGLPESEISFFELMDAAGYRTACIGKWHLGYNEPFLPQDKSIDEFYGFYEAFSLYAPKGNREIVNQKHKNFQNKHIWRQKRKGPSAIVHNGEEVLDNGYLTTRLAEEACNFISENEKNPFFLYIPFNAPHTPFQAPKSYFDRFPNVKDKNKRVYYAMIAALDDAVGQIMNQVKESGIEKNTLIFFTSDNGGATYTGATSNGDLKGGKRPILRAE